MASTPGDFVADFSSDTEPLPLGVLLRLYRTEDYAGAHRYAQGFSPDEATVEFLNLAGVCAKRAGDLPAAESYYRRALQKQQDFTAARNNLAILLQETRRSEEAEKHYLEALRLAPEDALPHLNLGNLYLAQSQYAQAEKAYCEALRLNPRLVEAMRYKAELFIHTERKAQAPPLLEKALALRPDDVDILLRLASLAFESGQREEALARSREVAAAAPAKVEQLTKLAGLFHELKCFAEAEATYLAALALAPSDANLLNDMGILLQETGRFEASLAYYQQALAIRPDYAEGWNNLAVLAQKLKRFDEAEKAYQKALTHRPDYAAARCNYGLLCLTVGRFEEGWPLYEARYAPDRTVPFPKLSKPQWQGESLEGKGILIWNEQGMGDEIQFSRFAKILKARGAKRVGLVCKAPLVSLMRTLEGVDDLHPEGTKFSIRPYDYWTFPLTIPRYCCPTPAEIPQSFSYLRADPALCAHWAPRLAANGIKVGLVWKGRAEYSNDANRSLPSLKTLAPLWAVPGVHFFSLQKGEAEDEASAPPADQPLVALGAELRDFADTAAIVSQLDLVICVDTGIAHLCGALGVPCWVLLPFVGTDWRWMLGRSDSPWYPSLRLFRQPAPADWGRVIEQVKAALACRAQPAGDALMTKIRSLPEPQQAFCETLIDLVSGSFAVAVERLLPFSDWVRLADLLHQAGRLEAAHLAYQKALAANSRTRGVWHNFAVLCRLQKNDEAARDAYQKALEAEGPYAEGFYNLGNLHEARGDYADAAQCYHQAIELKPGYAEAWYNLGVVLKHQSRWDEAEAAFKKAIALRGDYSEAHNNLGMVLQARGEGGFQDAEQQFRRAIEMSPVAAEAHNNLGVVLQLQHRFDEAATEFEKAAQLRPDFANAQWNLSLMHLMRGDFLAAWPLFSARIRITQRQSHPPEVPFPEWQGEGLVGKRILIWPEQGLGDEIQFSRYASQLKALGAATVTLVCKPSLYRLFQSLEGVDACVELSHSPLRIPRHDFWAFSMSLPGRLGTCLETIPAALPYLYARQPLPKIEEILQALVGKKVGLVWAGSKAHPNDAHRSLKGFADFLPLLDVPGIRFVSLQVDDDEDAALLTSRGVARLGPLFSDFSDSATAISQLDLVICVDTATAHLAGALGVATWVLLPFSGLDWRWLARGTQSPWYPNVMKLFRQEKEMPWGAVVASMGDALRRWAAALD